MSTPISQFYANKSIFITGATGFIGKVLVEKLLFECPDIDKIYILLRSKRGQSPKQRLEDFTRCEYFTACHRVSADTLRSKLEAVVGDITIPELGLSQEDRHKLIQNVSIVFHSAASVKFDDPLRECLNFNVLGTKSVMDLCKELSHLDSFVHVSTAYAYCHQEQADEKVYDMKVTPNQMLQAAEWLDRESLALIKESVSEGRPNTYTFTKALAEQYINANKGTLPVAIARPSIVMARWKEPAAGWIDSYNGPGGMMLLGALGIARTMRFGPQNTADLIPVDVVVNALINIAWYTAETSRKTASDLKVFNITTGTTNPVTWYDYLQFSREAALRNPSKRTVRPPAQVPSGQGVSPVSQFFSKWISEVLFAYVVDFILILAGHKAMMVNAVKRMHHALSLLNYFCCRSWTFPCRNLTSLIDFMRKNAPTDLETFYMDTREIEWEGYISQCYMGARRYLLKETDDTVKHARQRMWRIALIYRTALVAFFLLIAYLVYLVPYQRIGDLASTAFTSTARSMCHHVS